MLWVWLSLGWVASAMDRTITGPVMTYMIDNEVPLFQGVENPFAVGGLIGSLLFAGYTLMQFPGGYMGDRFGHRGVIVISIVWASIATVISGLMTAVIGLVAMRVLTGIGAGIFYSNDRTVITHQTPFEKRSFGMGVVITGLAIGITLAFLLAAPLISLGTSIFGADGAWRMPFIVMGVAAAAIGFGMARFFRSQTGEHEYRPNYAASLRELAKYAAVFLVAVMAMYFFALQAGLPEWAVAVLITVLAIALVAFIFRSKGEEVAPVLYNRSLMLIYLSFIAILWHLWFFGFWSVSIVSDASGGATFLQAALTTAFNAGAGILGFPAGGWLADYAKRRGWGRKGMLTSFMLILSLMIFGFGFYIMNGGQALWVMGILLFVSSLFFNALQPMNQALAADLTSPVYLGAMFGMMNLIGEIGAVLSPTISGVLRDATGTWNTAVMVDAGILFVAFVLLLFVRESREEVADGSPRAETTG